MQLFGYGGVDVGTLCEVSLDDASLSSVTIL